MKNQRILTRYRELAPKLGHSQACIQVATEEGVTALSVSQTVTLHEMGRGAG